MPLAEFTSVGVIGAGTMGIGVTADLVLHGIHTVLVDISTAQLEKAKEEIIQTVRFAPLVAKSLPRLTEQEVTDQIQLTTDLRHIQDCGFIIENVLEDWQTKALVYQQLDAICPPEVCFGMNTSCTSITKMGGVTSRPHKIVGIHLMNPVFLKPVVEVIRGYHTSEETLQQLNGLLGQLGKESIVVNDYPGFVSNRISHLFMNEAAFVLQDQVASVEAIDAVFKKCYGHTMGPLETADLIGLDTVVRSLDVLYESYNDTKFRCCPLLRKMVHAGLLGRKSGKGFYEYAS